MLYRHNLKSIKIIYLLITNYRKLSRNLKDEKTVSTIQNITICGRK